MQWVNPFTDRIKVSTRIRNLESAEAKVNDADGNPIEIAAVVVWQVRDTAHAIYSVDNYTHFVSIQTETAVRHIASSYPYDSRGSGAMSLRDNADEITQRLSAELTDRVRSAGVDIIESRLTRLSYAPEIAQAMLRTQQASAVVGARQVIVEGAVGMVRWRWNGSRKKASSNWTKSGRPRWCRTCWSSCAASKQLSRSSTPARCTSDRTADSRTELA